jgi:4-amino-4-deoxy-L-arabinose transferase-like glycosyltransferase
MIALALLIGWFMVATVPFLSDFPPISAPETGIAAPAYKLASSGIYGNDLYQGFYRTEELNYEYLPLHPLLVAASFKILGLSVWSGRIVSVLSGLVVLILTFWLGRQLYNATVGLFAGFMLVVLRLGLSPESSGIPLIELSRIIRYDIVVPIWVLACCITFYWASQNNSQVGYLFVGIFGGLATLSHVYGSFVIPLIWLAYLWQNGISGLRRKDLYLVLAGWMLTILPWVFYVLQDINAFQGQLLRHESRFDLLNPIFYFRNVVTEPLRYLSWIGGDLRRPILWPRLGIWVVCLGLIAVNVVLLIRIRRSGWLADRLLILSLPVLGGLLAILISFKRFSYVALLMPFIALEIGLLLKLVWAWSRKGARPSAIIVVMIVIGLILEGGAGVVGSLQSGSATRSYLEVTREVASVIPAGSRIMMLHRYWLGLHEYHARSVDLAFVRANSQYGYSPTPSMEEVILEIDPEYIIMEDNLLQTGLEPSFAEVNPVIANQWHQFDQYLNLYCADQVASLIEPGYGNIKVLRCD